MLFGEAGWAVLRLWQTGKASAKVVDDLLASLSAATVPAPGYAQLPFSRASDVRRALEGYAAQHHLGFEARDIRFENGSLLPRRSSLAAADPRALHCRRSPSADHAHDLRSLRRGPDRVSVPCGLRCRPVHSPPASPLFCREWFRAAELAGVARYGFEELHNEDGDRVYRGPLSGEWARCMPYPTQAASILIMSLIGNRCIVICGCGPLGVHGTTYFC